MKRTIAILLAVLLLLSAALAGCTDPERETGTAEPLPTADKPVGGNPGETAKEPVGTGNGETADPSDTPTDPEQTQALTGTVSDGSEETEDDGYEIVSEYTVNVDGSVGFGGN